MRPETDVRTAARLLSNGSAVLLDVRDPEEIEAASIVGAITIPMQAVPQRLQDLPDAPLLVLCHSGMRSAAVTQYLRRCGRDASNIQGGIDAWSRVIDPQVPRY